MNASATIAGDRGFPVSEHSWIDGLGTILGAGGLVAGVTGFWAWLTSRPKGQADIQASQAAYSQALNAQSESFGAAMFKLVEQKDGVIATLQADMEIVKQQNLECQAESRQQKSIIRSLRAELVRAGVLQPPPPMREIGITPSGDPVFGRDGLPIPSMAHEIPATAAHDDDFEGGEDV